MIGRGGERGSGISVLMARYDDTYKWNTHTHIHTYMCVCIFWHMIHLKFKTYLDVCVFVFISETI